MAAATEKLHQKSCGTFSDSVVFGKPPEELGMVTVNGYDKVIVLADGFLYLVKLKNGIVVSGGKICSEKSVKTNL